MVSRYVAHVFSERFGNGSSRSIIIIIIIIIIIMEFLTSALAGKYSPILGFSNQQD
jgi:hypothetical protein